MTPWTDAKVQTMKSLWAEGLSASQIAGRLGGVSRNAVIGKVHRMGLPGRATTIRLNHRIRRSKESINSVRSIRETKPVVFQPDPIPYLEPEDMPAKLFTFIDWPETGCKQPFTAADGATLFGCTCKKMHGQPYCDGHARINFKDLVEYKKQPQTRIVNPNQILRVRTYELGEV